MNSYTSHNLGKMLPHGEEKDLNILLNMSAALGTSSWICWEPIVEIKPLFNPTGSLTEESLQKAAEEANPLLQANQLLPINWQEARLQAISSYRSLQQKSNEFVQKRIRAASYEDIYAEDI